MAKKITGFKVFLWSMLGTVAGAFVLGAFANITRDDEKKETPTEITLETFQDSNNYMEVILEEGDKVGGCWLRIYSGAKMFLDGEFEDDEAGFGFNILISPEDIGVTQGNFWHSDLTYAHYGSESDPAKAYVDFYLPVGEVTFEEVSGSGQSDLTYTVTSETSILSIEGVHCYKLEVI